MTIRYNDKVASKKRRREHDVEEEEDQPPTKASKLTTLLWEAPKLIASKLFWWWSIDDDGSGDDTSSEKSCSSDSEQNNDSGAEESEEVEDVGLNCLYNATEHVVDNIIGCLSFREATLLALSCRKFMGLVSPRRFFLKHHLDECCAEYVKRSNELRIIDTAGEFQRYSFVPSYVDSVYLGSWNHDDAFTLPVESGGRLRVGPANQWIKLHEPYVSEILSSIEVKPEHYGGPEPSSVILRGLPVSVILPFFRMLVIFLVNSHYNKLLAKKTMKYICKMVPNVAAFANIFEKGNTADLQIMMKHRLKHADFLQQVVKSLLKPKSLLNSQMSSEVKALATMIMLQDTEQRPIGINLFRKLLKTKSFFPSRPLPPPPLPPMGDSKDDQEERRRIAKVSKEKMMWNDIGMRNIDDVETRNVLTRQEERELDEHTVAAKFTKSDLINCRALMLSILKREGIQVDESFRFEDSDDEPDVGATHDDDSGDDDDDHNDDPYDEDNHAGLDDADIHRYFNNDDNEDSGSDSSSSSGSSSNSDR